ncbi:hypothetical protein K456DRAFT_1361398 [Colletotrichum gloeosporioides 23]|nr:hypothetical protein K456DRAFT_1361398 [Colletotrichum gloeosporioides 23]
MEEYETEPDVPSLVFNDLRFPKTFLREEPRVQRQRKLARELSGYNPFDGYGRLFVEPQSLEATAAAGCLSCVLLKDVCGRLCHTDQLWVGEGDMEGRRVFFLHNSPHRRPDRLDSLTPRGLFLHLKDDTYVIYTMEGEPCPWDAIPSLPWSGYLPTLDHVRRSVQCAFNYTLEEHIEPPVLPTRLVMLHDGQPQGNIGPVVPLEVRLIEPSSIAQTFKDDVCYIALSHCWGSPDVAARMLQTTTETIGAFSRSILWGGLTKTFQDAMLVAKCLGIRYIWIDSLCIVQDDAQDWAVEASRMASVYANAHLTISAMGATDGHQGLFINTGSEPIRRRGVHEIKLPGLQYPIYVRNNECHQSAASAYPLKLTDTPLLHRGWAFQERILSPLILHFTESELTFDNKRGGSSCECKELGHYINGTHSRDWLFGTGISSLGCWPWYRMVEMYVPRLLTSEADRLPAFSGIATTFQRRLPALGSYLAGL